MLMLKFHQKYKYVHKATEFLYAFRSFRFFSNESNNQKGIRLPGAKDIKDPWKILKDGVDETEFIPRDMDVVIIGGGIIGWSIAYFLRQNTTYTVAVIERDPSHSRSATVLGIGAIRQQFSEPENIQMSLYGAEFLRNAREHLSILDLDPPDIQFHPHGFLTLSSEKGFQELKSCYDVQKALGAKVELLRKEDIKSIWPWMNVEDVGGGIHGYENEGWFDSWQLLNALKKKACSLGAYQIHGEMIGTEYKVLSKVDNTISKKASNVVVRLIDGNMQPFEASKIVVAAGPWSASVGRSLGMGSKNSELGILPIPVEPRLQHVFVVSSGGNSSQLSQSSGASTPGIDCPFIVDYDGLNVRRDRLGGDFIVFLDTPPLSRSAMSNKVKSAETIDLETAGETGFEVDYTVFEKSIKPQLARRMPEFAANAVIRSAWAAPLDYNYIDQMPIIGNHPSNRSLLLATGCSGHGIEHSLAIGYEIFELLLFNEYKTIDLLNFGFHRFYERELVFEKEIF